MRNKKNLGFTLIELLIVFTLIAILIIAGIAMYRAQLLKGIDAKRKADMHKIKLALEEYEKDHNCYPPSLPSCDPGTGLQPYMSKIPCEPNTTKVNYLYYPDPTSICPKYFYLFTVLGNTNDAQIEELRCTAGCGPNQALAVFNYFDKSPSAPEPYKNSNPSSGEIPVSGYYGCVNGACVPIAWNSTLNKPECQPNYTFSNCANMCGDPANICRDYNE